MNIIYIVSILCFALCLVMFFYLKWYVKKRTSSSGLDERQFEIARLIAEIDRITDRDSQLVEERIKQLKEILEETDKRISLYKNEHLKGSTINKEETLYSNLGKGIRSALEISSKSDTIEISSKARQQLSNTLPANVIRTQSAPVVPPSLAPVKQIAKPVKEKEPQPKPPSKKQIRSHIDILINEGLPAQEIASRLGISTAEVNLALNLRRNK
ncbi:MAG: hypothetical protein FWD47_03270 [Treponema sp.]|nr:hypothetical protein [Treponema sp.]